MMDVVTGRDKERGVRLSGVDAVATARAILAGVR